MNSSSLIPGRLCLKKTDPFDSIKINKPKIGVNQDRTNTITIKEKTMSKTLLKNSA